MEVFHGYYLNLPSQQGGYQPRGDAFIMLDTLLALGGW